MRYLLALGLLGCSSDPCGDDGCTGSITVDAMSDPPTFDIKGLGEVSPTRLRVSVWIDGDPCESSVQGGIWEVVSLPEDALPVSYGVVPDGARETMPPANLNDKAMYEATFGVDTGGLSEVSTAPLTWTALFEVGEPDSVTTWMERCGD